MPQIEQTIQVSEVIHLHTIISTPNQPTSPTRPALVLFHFWGGAYNTYRPLITHLCSDFALIVPSLRGWGESSRPTNPGAYRTADYGADIVALLQKLNSDSPELFSNGVVLVGHSMGAKIAQLLLTQQHLLPPSVMIRGLVLLAPAPAGSHSLPPEMREQQVHAYDNVASAEFVVRNVLLGRLDAVSDRVVGEIVADAVAGSEGARAAWPRGYGKYGGALRVLVLVGELDRVETEQSVKKRTVGVLLQSGAGVKAVTLSGTGHLSPVEAQKEVADAIRGFHF
ncbi:hypothetical protein LTR48_005770 [Friedmanniomyces endolithicus]|uniref:AB hydrolase-1 domain-containing protein n=1 Tax=Rachicladosporium monterosium TaxID=1507873 RepID=A0ABR0L122_9PEZI|nr:hypothetical protein LTR48_005770 [Friedmanniomyces endolithicus]KAK5141848.1 hypothetical protein LTR32_005688 [Rachicladosporium monterosium]